MLETFCIVFAENSPLEGVVVKVNQSLPVEERQVLPVIPFEGVEFLVRGHSWKMKMTLKLDFKILTNTWIFKESGVNFAWDGRCWYLC